MNINETIRTVKQQSVSCESRRDGNFNDGTYSVILKITLSHMIN